jgi:nucleotide-binding universal stress UspA family protein
MAEVAETVSITGGVVVGDDGSECASRAVYFAGEEAKLRGCPLHVIRSWSISSAPRPATWRPGYVPGLPEYEEAVRAAMDSDTRRTLGELADQVKIELHPVHAPSAATLVAASQHAAMVVVGSRGRGGFTSLLLGSVAEQVVRHAASPVVVVRDVRRK